MIAAILDDLYLVQRLKGGLAPAQFAERVVAGWVKIEDPQGFAVIIGNYQLVPGPLVNPLAVLLPWIEVLCGVMLIIGA